jgi:AcrR family transcriptional regulator
MTRNGESEQHTRERLLGAAESVFAEKGFSGATVKEIADQAGVNVSLISYHFHGKEGILRACVERFGRERLQDARNILTPPENKEDLKAKLKLWMLQFLRCHVEDRNVCAILHRENLVENPFLWEVFESTFLKGFEAVARFFELGRKRGILKKDVDPAVAASIVFGSLTQLGKSQEVQQKWMGISIANEKYRNQVVEQITGVLLHGIL